MEWVAIVTVAAMVQFVWFGIKVGKMRVLHEVKAPEITGHPDFMRMFRVHYNTMEQLVLFFPGLWMFAYFIDARFAAGIGVVFIIARFIFYSSYMKDPKSRGTGFTIGFIAIATLIGGSLFAAVWRLL